MYAFTCCISCVRMFMYSIVRFIKHSSATQHIYEALSFIEGAFSMCLIRSRTYTFGNKQTPGSMHKLRSITWSYVILQSNTQLTRFAYLTTLVQITTYVKV